MCLIITDSAEGVYNTPMNETKAQYLEYKRKFANMWVAKSKTTGVIVAAAKTLQELATNLVREKSSSYTIEKVLPPNVAFIS